MKADQLEIEEHIAIKKKLYQNLIDYVENEDETLNAEFINKLNQIKESGSIEDKKLLLNMILSISNNHYRDTNFQNKIENLISHFSSTLKQIMTNSEIFEFFKSNKLLILYLLKIKRLQFDYQIIANIKKDALYMGFFYPEIKSFLNEDEKETQLIGENTIEDYERKRKIGQNDDYVCTLIRNDDVEEFISYFNQTNFSLTNTIKRSAFETNLFLIDKDPMILEYAAFFGSVQIIQYLIKNNVKPTPELWLYAIHPNNAEIIEILENNHIYPENNEYEKCFEESIKCHHNEIASYIQDNLLKNENEDHFDCIIQCYNYSFFPDISMLKSHFYNLYVCGYSTISDYFIKEYWINNRKINQGFLFIMLGDLFDESIQKAAKNNDTLAIYSILLKLKQIKDEYFNSNKKLTHLIIPPSIKSIEKGAFSQCSSLVQVWISSSVTEIGNSVFSYCSSLTQITIPSSVTSIGNNAFYHCKSLTQIAIPSSVTSIGETAFCGCLSLTQITIPSSLNSIGDDPFCGCIKLEKITVLPCEEKRFEYFEDKFLIYKSESSKENYNTLVWYKPGQNTVTIPPFIVTIGCSAFEGCSSLTQVTIPSSVTLIGNYAFLECSSLAQITIPSSVTLIGNGAFYGCLSLTQITIPSSVTYIGDSSFYGCSKLAQITIPSSVTEIGNNVFNRCSSLTQITIPSSITSIGFFAFSYCKSLTEITIPSSVTSIGNSAFSYCKSLTQITIPSSVTEIDEYVFSECSSLTQITILSSVTYIGYSTFERCSSLTQIAIPSSVTSIGNYAFKGCSSLTQITIPSSVTSIGDYTFEGCSSLAQIAIPSSVTSIGFFAFRGCSSLTQMTIPSSVIDIGYSAFEGCSSLTQITMPAYLRTGNIGLNP